MSGRGASQGDMANFLKSVPGDSPNQGDYHLEVMLSGQPLPENASAELRGVGELLATLREAPMDRLESRGQVGALNAFRKTFASSELSRRRRPARLSAILGAALAAGAVSFGAIGAAAYTGVLPAGLQDLAHTTIGAPAAHPGGRTVPNKAAPQTTDQTADTPTFTAVGPDAAGLAAFGLCTAWDHAKTNGQAADKSIAFRNLVTAAGGADNVIAYCAKIPHPGATATGKPTSHPTGKPTSHPTGSSTSRQTGKPTSHPTGSSTSHQTGKPTSHPTGSGPAGSGR